MMQRFHIDRLLAAVLGAWLALAATMAFVATSNFRVTDLEHLRNADTVFAAFEAPAERRMAVRYVASELNRFFFQRYDAVQGVLAALALAGVLAAGGRRGLRLALVAALVAIVLVNALYFTPTLVALGREIDFVPRDGGRPAPVKHFYRLHGINVSLELGKLALLAVAILLVARRGPEKRGEAGKGEA